MVSEEYYDDWLSDNIDNLKSDFLEENEELWSKFCRDEFSKRER